MVLLRAGDGPHLVLKSHLLLGPGRGLKAPLGPNLPEFLTECNTGSEPRGAMALDDQPS